ncbi:uncharacterized protein PAC_08868 [Phialocephala subalpina]|uniref:Uncharacterized protein n=1 Tax=Phialocephala subalpina TaxID=576137 RepID=A0A1L7X1S2_9HELO|nr:uncharacterized protein PAC_08868 [Phialocephala subalpina]
MQNFSYPHSAGGHASHTPLSNESSKRQPLLQLRAKFVAPATRQSRQGYCSVLLSKILSLCWPRPSGKAEIHQLLGSIPSVHLRKPEVRKNGLNSSRFLVCFASHYETERITHLLLEDTSLTERTRVHHCLFPFSGRQQAFHISTERRARDVLQDRRGDPAQDGVSWSDLRLEHKGHMCDAEG